MINRDNEESPQEPMPLLYVSPSELSLVKNHIILPYIMRTLEHDVKVIQVSKLKYPHLYADRLAGSVVEVLREMNTVKLQLRQQNIKVYEVKRDSTIGRWEYILRGNRHEIGFLWNIVRAEVEIYLMDKFGLKY